MDKKIEEPEKEKTCNDMLFDWRALIEEPGSWPSETTIYPGRDHLRDK